MRARLDIVLQHPSASLPGRRRCRHRQPSSAAGRRSRPSCRSLPRCSSSDRPPLLVFVIIAAPSSPLAGCLLSQSTVRPIPIRRPRPGLVRSRSAASAPGPVRIDLPGNRPSASRPGSTCFDPRPHPPAWIPIGGWLPRSPLASCPVCSDRPCPATASEATARLVE
jgi:hypothetical protein